MNGTLLGAANDSDAEGDTLTIVQVNGQTISGNQTISGTYGDLTIQTDGGYEYTLDTASAAVEALGVGESLPETFTYQVSDGNGGTDQATLTITIHGTNDAPTLTADTAATNEGVSLTIAATDLVANGNDVDTNDSLSLSGVGNALNGSVEIDGGNVVFTPTPGFTGDATFEYTVSDGNGGTATETVTVTVHDGLVASASALQVAEDGAADWKLSVSGGSGTLTYGLVAGTGETLTSGPGSETLTTSAGKEVILDTATGAYTYTAAQGYTGEDSFDFRVTDDATGVSSTATVDVGVGTEPAFEIANSVRLDSDNYLSWTPGGLSVSSWTLSTWVKWNPAESGSYATILDTKVAQQTGADFQLSLGDGTTPGKLVLHQSPANIFVTTEAFDDPNAWYHIVVAVDEAASGSDKIKLYVDGDEITAFDTDNRSTASGLVVMGNHEHRFGDHRYDHTNCEFDGAMADIHFVEGSQLAATKFGFRDSDLWRPTEYTDSYGTRDFHLDFADGANLGTDASDNGNSWSPSAGLTTADRLNDSPTQNYATFDPTLSGGGITFSDGNLQISQSGSGQTALSTVVLDSTSPPVYWEMTIDTIGSGPVTGVANASADVELWVGQDTGGWSFFAGPSEGQVQHNGAHVSPTTLGGGSATGDVIMMAYDPATGSLWAGRNGTWFGDPVAGTGYMFTGITGPVRPGGTNWHDSTSTFNFGATDFVYTPPAGYGGVYELRSAAQVIAIDPTAGHDSIEGTAEADSIDGLAGDDKLIGNGGDDTLNGGAGNDRLIGGEGDDTLEGGTGSDIASYTGSRSLYDILYDGETGHVTVSNTLSGNDGTDRLTGIEVLTFDQGTPNDNSDDITVDLTGSMPVATNSAVQTAKNGSATWTLAGSGGEGALTYSFEGTFINNTVGPYFGWHKTPHGYVTATDEDGGYEYHPEDGYEGADTFEFKVTDENGVSSKAKVNIGVGTEPAFEIANSVRLDSDNYLSWTPGGPSVSSWTLSTWVKWNPAESGSYATILDTKVAQQTGADFQLSLGDGTTPGKLVLHQSPANIFVTTAAFTDPNKWYHIVVAVDEAVSGSNKIKLYVDGDEITAFDTDNRSTASGLVVMGNHEHRFGDHRYDHASCEFDGAMANIHFVEGSQLEATAFGSDDSGGWRPAEYTGGHGTTGFHLDFADETNLGNDVSDNANDWSQSAGLTAADQLNDSPTQNYATFDPALSGGGITFSDGNLQLSQSGSGQTALSTVVLDSSSPAVYWEMTVDTRGSGPLTGVVDAGADVGTWLGHDTGGWSYQAGSTGWAQHDGANVSPTAVSGASADGDVVMMAYDPATGSLWAGRNGTWYGDPEAGTGYMFTGITGPVRPAGTNWSDGASTFNFGASDFVYGPPARFSGVYELQSAGQLIAIDPTSGHDSIEGTAEADSIDGLAGDDQLDRRRRRRHARRRRWQ